MKLSEVESGLKVWWKDRCDGKAIRHYGVIINLVTDTEVSVRFDEDGMDPDIPFRMPFSRLKKRTNE